MPGASFSIPYSITTSEPRLEIRLVSSLAVFSPPYEDFVWFLPYVGLLKMEIESGDLTYMGMTFPVTLSGKVELVEFRP